jgi:hypothetical protein
LHRRIERKCTSIVHLALTCGLPAIKHRFGIGRPIHHRNFGQCEPEDYGPVGRIARRYTAADRKSLIDALDDLFPGFVIDDLCGKIETLLSTIDTQLDIEVLCS